MEVGTEVATDDDALVRVLEVGVRVVKLVVVGTVIEMVELEVMVEGVEVGNELDISVDDEVIPVVAVNVVNVVAAGEVVEMVEVEIVDVGKVDVAADEVNEVAVSGLVDIEEVEDRELLEEVLGVLVKGVVVAVLIFEFAAGT